MPPYTEFSIEDPYIYMEGFGQYHTSEALPNATPKAINSPQHPPYGLRTERMSGSSFTAPRHASHHSFLYRIASSLDHTDFTPYDTLPPSISNPPAPSHITPNSYLWPTFPPVPTSPNSHKGTSSWLHQPLLASNGKPLEKKGLSIYIFAASQDMPPNTAFASLDGETLIVPQAGTLDIQTEYGRLLVRQSEIAVIPRGVRYRVTLPSNTSCRGYIVELYEGHFRLPELGAIGTSGLANVRDFQVPVACLDDTISVNPSGIAVAAPGAPWTIIARLNGRLWCAHQPHTPFDVAAWHGTCYPYKYDLGRFKPIGSLLSDEPDPSLFVVLTAPSYGSPPGTAVVDFAVLPPRWAVAEGTYRAPYWHRNTMQEFFGAVVTAQGKKGGTRFSPLGGGLHGSMSAHGSSEEAWEEAKKSDSTKPVKLGEGEGFMVFLVEVERPLLLSEWGVKAVVENIGGNKDEIGVKAKM